MGKLEGEIVIAKDFDEESNEEVKLLLDTHVFLWMLSEPDRIEQKVQRAIIDPRHQVFVSAVTGLEIEIKRSLDKLRAPDDLESEITSRSLLHLPMHFKHGLRLRSLPTFHSDPFDRLLIAQALDEHLTLVTADEKIIRYPVKTMKT